MTAAPLSFWRVVRIGTTLFSFAVRIAAAQVAPGSNPATTPVPRAESWWIERHREKVAEACRGNVDLLFLGDSITENYEKIGTGPAQNFYPIWRELFEPHRAMNLGFSGDDTEHVLWRLHHGEVDGLHPSQVVILIGTNNTARGQRAGQVSQGILAVIAETQRLLPSAHLLIVGILPSAISSTKSAADLKVNALVREHVAGMPRVDWLDLGHLFLIGGELDSRLFYDQLLPEPRPLLHPNAAGQRRMAKAIAVELFGTGPSLH